MGIVTVYTRKILERTGYIKHPYKEVKQVIIKYNGMQYSNCWGVDIDNTRLKIPFKQELISGNIKKIKEYLKSLGMTEGDKFIKKTILEIIERVPSVGKGN